MNKCCANCGSAMHSKERPDVVLCNSETSEFIGYVMQRNLCCDEYKEEVLCESIGVDYYIKTFCGKRWRRMEMADCSKTEVFLEEWKRVCKRYPGTKCFKCPVYAYCKSPEEMDVTMISVLQKWSEEDE